MTRKSKDFVVFSISANDTDGHANFGMFYCFIPVRSSGSRGVDIINGNYLGGEYRYLKRGHYKIIGLNTVKTSACYFKRINDALAEIGRFCKLNSINTYEVVHYNRDTGSGKRIKFFNKN